jgi:hypothetical protein
MSSRSPTRARAFRFPAHALHALVDGGLQDLDQVALRDFDELRGYCSKVAGAVGVACVAVYGSDDVERAETLGIALQLINIIRDVREDWELGRVYCRKTELSSFGVSEDDIAAHNVSGAWHALMSFQAERARAYLQDGLGLLHSLDSRSALCVSTFAGLYRATLDRIEAARLRRLRGPAAPVGADEAPDRGTGPLVKSRVVGGGLAGLAAALELVERGHEVTLYEARPTLGGAVQTLPEREGDPDAAAGQRPAHRARLLHGVPRPSSTRIGEGGSYVRRPLVLPVLAEDGSRADVKPSVAALLSYAHVPLRDRCASPS